MQSLMRVVCVAYWIFLTSLLLTSDPMRLVGVRDDVPTLMRLLLPASHFLSFLVLTVLTLMVRWPAPRWGIAALLVLYGGLTEVAQSFTPVRTAEWADWLQDMVGIAVGVAFCRFVAMVGGEFVGQKQESEGFDLPGTSNE
jgi:VanZ family protein